MENKNKNSPHFVKIMDYEITSNDIKYIFLFYRNGSLKDKILELKFIKKLVCSLTIALYETDLITFYERMIFPSNIYFDDNFNPVLDIRFIPYIKCKVKINEMDRLF